MALDLSSLQKGVASLERSIGVAGSEIKGEVDTDIEEVIRAGVIQNFEFTYELCWKFIQRWLEVNVGASYVSGITRRELFRLAAEQKLIDDVDNWAEYHEARNETSHTYDQDKAEDVFTVAKKFLQDAKQLLANLEKRND